MKFLVNTGPVIPTFVVLILHKILCLGLLKLGKRFHKHKTFRYIGMYASEVNLTQGIVKLVIESYLDLLFAMAMTVVSLFRTEEDPTWSEYFSTFGDFVSNSFWLISIGIIIGLPFFEYQMIIYGTKVGLIE